MSVGRSNMTRKRRMVIIAIAALGVILAAYTANAETKKPSTSEKLPECIEVKGTAVSTAYGYNHVIAITSKCDTAAKCTVSTNSNPEKQEVTVPPGKEVELVVFRGSPARTFTVDASCELTTTSHRSA